MSFWLNEYLTKHCNSTGTKQATVLSPYAPAELIDKFQNFVAVTEKKVLHSVIDLCETKRTLGVSARGKKIKRIYWKKVTIWVKSSLRCVGAFYNVQAEIFSTGGRKWFFFVSLFPSIKSLQIMGGRNFFSGVENNQRGLERGVHYTTYTCRISTCRKNHIDFSLFFSLLWNIHASEWRWAGKFSSVAKSKKNLHE